VEEKMDTIEKQIEWVDELIQHLRRTRDPRDIRNSVWILEKRKQALIEQLTNNIDID
jgi:hypothetical protein